MSPRGVYMMSRVLGFIEVCDRFVQLVYAGIFVDGHMSRCENNSSFHTEEW